MIDVKIQALDDGPLLVQGSVEIMDGKGTVIEDKEQCYLCRCGASTNSPYCTGECKNKFKNKVREER